MIKTETRNNAAYDLAKTCGWPLPEKTYEVFVNEDGHEVDCKYIALHYGEATEENAAKYFAESQAAREAEEEELLEAECVGQVLKG